MQLSDDAILAASGQLRFDEVDFLPAVVQDSTTNAVLMIGFMNQEAFAATLRTGLVHFYSRSRDRLWQKGEHSGNTQTVESVAYNCDENSLLLRVVQKGAVCHDGYPSCFYREFQDDGSTVIVLDRWFDPSLVYGDDQNVIPTWWNAYRFLQEQVPASASSTAALLQESSRSVQPRIADELRELAGVLRGEHSHGSREEDVVLEGSQVLYWAVVESLRAGFTLADLNLPSALVTAVEGVPPGTVAALLEAEADRWSEGTDAISPDQVSGLVALVAQAALSAGVAPIDLIKSDLVALREKPYLAHFFEQSSR